MVRISKMTRSGVRAISLFSGCGGSDLALLNGGYEVVWANDVWEPACRTYEANLGSGNIQCGDIAKYDSFPSAELLVGCYPCQGYTQGGKRDWGAPINFLYRQFDRALRSIQPVAFIVENVNGMAYGESRGLLENQLRRYRLAGYRVKWAVMNAKDYGVAQNRRRVFLVGVRSSLDFHYDFPSPTHGEIKPLLPLVNQKAALSGLPKWPAGEFNDEPFHWYYLSRRRRHDWDEPSPCIVGHWRHVPLHPMSPPLKRIHTDKWEFEYEGRARRLAYRECAAIQGFPDTFTWDHGSVRDRFQMIGNAVPPPLFAAVLSGLDNLWIRPARGSSHFRVEQ
jgi:DNA (cytosine-5)-methyltransferase 1